MGRYYLAPFVGTGQPDDPYRPPTVGARSIIDLRGDVTDQAGHCLVRLDTPETVPGAVDLGDDLDGLMPRSVSQTLENTLRVTLDTTDRLRQIIVELLLLHGTIPSDRTRWNVLKATRAGFLQIIIGKELIYRARPIVGTTITESFNKSDNGLGPDLSWTAVVGTFAVSSNRATESAGSNPHSVRAESDLASDDHYAQAEDWNSDIGSNRPGVAVRFDSSASTFYRAQNRNDGSDFEVSRFVTGSETQISSQAGEAGASGQVIRLEVDGSSLTGIYDGTTYASDTDTNITGFVRAGLAGQHSGSNRNAWDNFEAGDLVSVTLEQEGFRWRDDDGSESAASWLQTQDVDTEQPVATNVRLRVLTDATSDPDTAQATLQYKRDDEASSEWRTI